MSVVSLWEIGLKRSLGRIDVNLSELVEEISQSEGFRLLDLTPLHALAADELPYLNGDPFDRMLVAQAVAEHATLATKDRSLREYPVEVLW